VPHAEAEDGKQQNITSPKNGFIRLFFPLLGWKLIKKH
jgi:hypothetical protein